jgi:hypothetical protein
MPDDKPSEINSKVLVGIMIVTMLISLGGTFLLVSKISSLQPKQVVYTGYATSEQGSAIIEIQSMLSIDVDNNNNTIDFGLCNPPQDSDTNASISSAMTETQINATLMNCSGAQTPAAIVIVNVGNVPANITVKTAKLGSTLLGGTSRGEFFYKTSNASTNGGCGASRIQTAYTKFTSITTEYNVCRNLTTTAGTFNRVFFWVNLTVPNDASTPAGAGGDTATLTFSGWGI